MDFLRRLVTAIDSLVDWCGRIASTIVYLLLGLLALEVFLRYALNAPTSYAHEISAMLFAVMFLIGGSYALRWNAHISVEILYARLPARGRALLDLFTWTLFYLFIGTLFWKSVPYALDSVAKLERSSSALAPYIWPVKLCLPLGAFLMLLSGLAKTIRDLVLVVSGHELDHVAARKSSFVNL